MPLSKYGIVPVVAELTGGNIARVEEWTTNTDVNRLKEAVSEAIGALRGKLDDLRDIFTYENLILNGPPRVGSNEADAEPGQGQER